MKKKILFTFGAIAVVIMLTINVSLLKTGNQDTGLTMSGLIGISQANAEMGEPNYEDKFDLSVGFPGGISLGVCCDIDVTNGCWSIWRNC